MYGEMVIKDRITLLNVSTYVSGILVVLAVLEWHANDPATRKLNK
jgi:hypothetical protein